MGGSKNHCVKIKDEIKNFLEKDLALSFSIEKTKITHMYKNRVLFLGYSISCTPTNRMSKDYNLKKIFTKKSTKANLNAPIKRVIEKLHKKGFVNNKGNPTRNGKYINHNLWNIIDSYLSIERGILNYYKL